MSLIPFLDDSTWFPPTSEALDDPNGLLAAGGDLSPQRILSAYQQGIFPWYEAGQPILWWSPAPRTVLKPSEIHISRSLRKELKRKTFQVTMDTAFSEVIAACAAPRDCSSDTWITQEMQQAYIRLHQLGFAHSVECWKDGMLAGGLYGIAQGKMFFGESMFSRASNASKVALVHLAKQLEQWDYQLIDCQMHTDHLASLGAEEISREQFESHLPDKPDLPDALYLPDRGKNSMDSRKAAPWVLSWDYET